MAGPQRQPGRCATRWLYCHRLRRPVRGRLTWAPAAPLHAARGRCARAPRCSSTCARRSYSAATCTRLSTAPVRPCGSVSSPCTWRRPQWQPPRCPRAWRGPSSPLRRPRARSRLPLRALRSQADSARHRRQASWRRVASAGGNAASRLSARRRLGSSLLGGSCHRWASSSPAQPSFAPSPSMTSGPKARPPPPPLETLVWPWAARPRRRTNLDHRLDHPRAAWV